MNTADSEAMRVIAGPIAALLVLCGWDVFYHHGKYTQQLVQAASAIVHRAF
jgi:hypothetical protein